MGLLFQKALKPASCAHLKVYHVYISCLCNSWFRGAWFGHVDMEYFMWQFIFLDLCLHVVCVCVFVSVS